jgi:hypothetical protein
MPVTTQNATWDYNPNDTVTLKATFTFDLSDSSDTQTVASVLATLNSRTPSVSLVQSDNATISVSLTI